MLTRLFNQPVDMSKVSTLVYHLPDGFTKKSILKPK